MIWHPCVRGRHGRPSSSGIVDQHCANRLQLAPGRLSSNSTFLASCEDCRGRTGQCSRACGAAREAGRDWSRGSESSDHAGGPERRRPGSGPFSTVAGWGRSMLQSRPSPLRSRPSRRNRLVMPRATPVSTTRRGRTWHVRHQAALANDGTASNAPSSQVDCSSDRASRRRVSTVANQAASNSALASHGQGFPRSSWSLNCQSSSTA